MPDKIHLSQFYFVSGIKYVTQLMKYNILVNEIYLFIYLSLFLSSGGAQQDLPYARHPAEGWWKHLHQLQVRVSTHRPERGPVRHHTYNL